MRALRKVEDFLSTLDAGGGEAEYASQRQVENGLRLGHAEIGEPMRRRAGQKSTGPWKCAARLHVAGAPRTFADGAAACGGRSPRRSGEGVAGHRLTRGGANGRASRSASTPHPAAVLTTPKYLSERGTRTCPSAVV